MTSIPFSRQAVLEESLRTSEARFRAMFEQSAVGMAIADRGGRLERINEAYARMLGYQVDDLIGKSLLEITHPDDVPRTVSLLMRPPRFPRSAVTYEKRYVRKDGGVIWVRVTVSLLFDEQGVPEGYTGVIEDITAAQEALQALESQFDLQRSILDEMPLMIAIWRDGRPVYLNRELRRVLGYSLADLGDEVATRLFPGSPDDARRMCDALERPAQRWEDFEPLAHDGSTVLSSWNCMRLADGSTLAIGQDLRERRKLETQMAQAQRMEAIGTLAAGVAHDFNNLLTVILASAAFIRMNVAETTQPSRDAAEITRAAERASALTRQLLAFSRQQVLNPEVVDVNAEISQSARALQRMIGEHIQLTVIPAAERSCVEVDVHQLNQVVMNLAVNARDAIGQNGTIAIATDNVERLEADGAPREYLALSISDDGSGIPPEIRDQIFNPFFTTKEIGRGTGLGLATVHGIVTQSGGRVELDSEVGRGTTFRILLPTANACPMHRAPPNAEAQARRCERVLVVEDESAVRAAACRMLRGAGYTVLEARHGEDALEVIEGQGPVDLLITDMVMPQMGGAELARAARARHPMLPVLFMTGYTDEELLRQGALEHGAEVLRKPFVTDDLLAAVSSLIDRVAA
jgi:PAS domain S-box-containing protein